MYCHLDVSAVTGCGLHWSFLRSLKELPFKDPLKEILLKEPLKELRFNVHS